MRSWYIWTAQSLLSQLIAEGPCLELFPPINRLLSGQYSFLTINEILFTPAFDSRVLLSPSFVSVLCHRHVRPPIWSNPHLGQSYRFQLSSLHLLWNMVHIWDMPINASKYACITFNSVGSLQFDLSTHDLNVKFLYPIQIYDYFLSSCRSTERGHLMHSSVVMHSCSFAFWVPCPSK